MVRKRVAVQRVLRLLRAQGEQRKGALEDIGFDWFWHTKPARL